MTMRRTGARHFRVIAMLTFVIALFGMGVLGAAAQSENPACAAGASFEAGQSNHSMTWGEGERSYRLYVPESYDPAQPTPLVLSLHGFASNPAQQEGFSAWNAVADEENFIVAYPAGTGFPLRWNSGLFTGAVDDTAFLADLIDHLSDEWCIDPARVYINGLSNGAGMSYRFACEMADRVAAIGGVAGAYNAAPGGCEPSQPVPVILFHGTDDPIVPYEGGTANDPGATAFPSVEEYARDWAERNECELTPETISGLPDSVSAIRYTGCADDVEVAFYTILGGGHTWSGSGETIPAFIGGATNREIESSAVMWAFFERYTRD